MTEDYKVPDKMVGFSKYAGCALGVVVVSRRVSGDFSGWDGGFGRKG